MEVRMCGLSCLRASVFAVIQYHSCAGVLSYGHTASQKACQIWAESPPQPSIAPLLRSSIFMGVQSFCSMAFVFMGNRSSSSAVILSCVDTVRRMIEFLPGARLGRPALHGHHTKPVVRSYG